MRRVFIITPPNIILIILDTLRSDKILSIYENKDFKKKKSITHQINNHSTPKFIFGEYIKSKKRIENFKKSNKKSIKRKIQPKVFSNMYFIRSNTHKYIKFDCGIEEFYDLITDPNEQMNNLDENNDIYNELKLNLIMKRY